MATRRIIRGATLLPFDGRGQKRRADVLVDGGRIAAVGGLEAGGAKVNEARGVILPAAVQAHLHTDCGLLGQGFVPSGNPRRLAKQWATWRGIQDAESAYVSAWLSLGRAMMAGCGTVADAAARPQAFLRAAEALGVRGSVYVLADNPSFEKELLVIEERLKADGLEHRARMGLLSRGGNRRGLARALAVAKERAMPLVLESGPDESTSVASLDRAKLLGPNLVLTGGRRGSFGGRREHARLAETRTSVVLTPSYYILTGAPWPDVAGMAESGVRLALSSHSAATGLAHDPFREARLVYAKISERVAEPASMALAMMTRNGAEALHQPSGSIEVGKQADLLILQLESETDEDFEATAGRVLRSGGPNLIRDLMIDGAWVSRPLPEPATQLQSDLRERLLGDWAQDQTPYGRAAMLLDRWQRWGFAQKGWHGGA